jgi:hypothetical protein
MFPFSEQLLEISAFGAVRTGIMHFYSFGATAHIWALACLHETFRFTSVY